MSVRTVVGGRLVVHVFAVVTVTAGVLALASALDAALAQAGPLVGFAQMNSPRRLSSPEPGDNGTLTSNAILAWQQERTVHIALGKPICTK
jgi:hypothetical protein